MSEQLALGATVIATTYVQLLHIGQTEGLHGTDEHFITDGDGTESIMSLGTAAVGVGTETPSEIFEVEHPSSDTGTHTTMSINTIGAYNSVLEFKSGGAVKWGISNAGANDRFYIQDDEQNGLYMNQTDTSFTGTSDLSLKTDISVIADALTKVNAIRGVNFKWKKYKSDGSNPNSDRDVNRVGCIAQEVNEVLPEAVDSKEDGNWGVRYTEIIPLLIESVKELSAKVTALENA